MNTVSLQYTVKSKILGNMRDWSVHHLSVPEESVVAGVAKRNCTPIFDSAATFRLHKRKESAISINI